MKSKGMQILTQAEFDALEASDLLVDGRQYYVIDGVPRGLVSRADFDAEMANKVDKEDGKVLSENDLTDELKGNYDTAYSHSQQIGNPHGTEIPEIDKTSNILTGDGNGNAVDSGISTSTILNTLTAVTTTGNPVNIQNTNDGFVDKVKIIGGKNRFNIIKQSTTYDNVTLTNNGDETITLNGTATQSRWSFNGMTTAKTFKANTTYCISYHLLSGTGTGPLGIEFNNTDYTAFTKIGDNGYMTFSFTEETTISNIALEVDKTCTFTNAIYGLMLTESSSISAYEPYTVITSPLTGKSVGKNWLDFANATFYDADYGGLNFNINTTQNNIISKTDTEIQVQGSSSGAYQGVATLIKMPVGTYKLSALATILSGTGPVSIRWATYANESDAQNGSLLINQGSDNATIVITEANQWLLVGCYIANSDPASTASLSEMQLEKSPTATDYEPYTATAFSIPLKDTSGTVLDLNPADVIEMIDGKYHLNDTELHDESQDALRAIPTKAGQTNLIGDQPFTFDVTEFQLGLESIDAMLTLPNGKRVNVITKDRLIYITSGEYAGKTLDYALQELKNEIDGKQNTLTFDDTPTSGSNNPVKSGGIKSYVDSAIADTESGVIYDQVIRTQTDFETLIASPTWLDAKSVALVGQFVYNEPDNSGIKIPSTVKQIHGFNSAKITITNFVYNSATARGGLWYDTLPTTPDYSIRDLEVDCTGTGSGYGFSYCTNLTNCTGTGTGTGVGGIGFRTCTNLTNCTGTGTGPIGGYGFSYCTNLTNCTGTGTGTEGYGYGFRECTNLSNCTGTGTGTGDEGYGFYYIKYASNCKDGGSSTAMWGSINKNINVETCRKTLVNADNTTLNI